MTNSEKAIFGAGCFWGVEAQFRKVTGVLDVVVGYCGGNVSHPTYRQVCSGRTGHAEVAQVQFDPSIVSYEDLLDVFFAIHDPTQLNRQGPDEGPQYRSVIIPTTTGQMNAAQNHLAVLKSENRFSKPIATTLETAQQFWPAEDYHQDYLSKNPHSQCHM